MTQPPKATSASSSRRKVPRSRSLVGSSSIKNVAAALQNFCEQNPAAFAAAELRDFGVDAVFAEKESPQISAQGDALFPERDMFSAAPDFFPNRFLVVEQEPVLIDVIDLGPRADLDFTAAQPAVPAESL